MCINKTTSCSLCGGKINKKELYIPGDFIWLIPARSCSCCGALHKEHGKIISTKKTISFFINEKILFIGKKEIFKNLSTTS